MITRRGGAMMEFSEIVFVLGVWVGLWFVFNPEHTKLDRLLDKRSSLMIKASIVTTCLATVFGLYLMAN